MRIYYFGKFIADTNLRTHSTTKNTDKKTTKIQETKQSSGPLIDVVIPGRPQDLRPRPLTRDLWLTTLQLNGA